jgi:VIT1/CCC1 family predicted Fe2+/Mn2+ transporter
MARRFAREHLSYTDLISEAAEAVYMVVIIIGYVALSQLSTQFYYIVAVDIGACIGWGFIDGFTYAIGSSIDRGNQASLVQKIQSEKNTQKSINDVVEELDGTFVSGFSDESKRSIAAEILKDSAGVPQVKQKFITRDELAGFASIMVVYLLAGIALSLPYLIFEDKIDAWLVSNSLGIIWLFYYGFRVGKVTRGRRILIGLLTSSAGIAFLIISYFVYG